MSTAVLCSQSSSSSSRASQVASRSTGVSKSGFRSTNSRSRSASQAIDSSSSPRRCSSSSIPRSVKYTPSAPQGAVEQLPVLLLVPLGGAGGRGRRGGPRGTVQRPAAEVLWQVQRDVRPRTHVRRLLLRPHDGGVRVLAQLGEDLVDRQWREL